MLSEIEQHRRKLAAENVALKSGSLTDLARELGLKPANAANWLRRFDPKLHRRLKGQPGRKLDTPVVLQRLIAIREARKVRFGMRDLARSMGWTAQRLCVYAQRWAPDGLDQAIADLMPDAEEAA
jgi:hypothetical protein